MALRRILRCDIHNRNTCAACDWAVGAFCAWCEKRGLDLLALTPMVIAGHLERLLAGGIGLQQAAETRIRKVHLRLLPKK